MSDKQFAGTSSNNSAPNKDNANSGELASAKEKLAPYNHYTDIMMCAAKRDEEEAGKTMELNERPAFSYSPNSVARLLPEDSKEDLVTDMIKEYA